ncbi:MAG: LysR substrate-binding domain-containing protein [Ottowia sp.]|uniref:LysR family transcriptional regulator n=1 Tax=unclassified Ottowia TaxID=2645081 RepID=UPI003C2BCF5F
MDRLACLQVFLEVANAGSFARAAMKLSVAKSTVTKQVAWLESTMGAQLLNRSAKQVTMTEAGRRVFDASSNLLECYEAMTSEVRDSTRSPKGMIRIGTPPSFGTYHLIPAVTRFTERYPEIEVSVMFDDERVSSVSDSLDLSIRILPALEDTSSVAMPLMSSPQVLVASPAYLKRHGRPRTVRELERHNCLVHTLKSQSSIWNFEGDPPQSVRVRGSVKSNMGDALKQAAILGSGISMHPIYMVSREIETGLLEVVLPEFAPQAKAAIYALYSTRRNLPSRVRCLLDYLKDWAQSPSTRAWTGHRP